MIDYFKEYFDFKTFLVAITLTLIGLISIYSATFDAKAGFIFYRQLIWGGIAFLGLLIAAFFPLKSLQRIAFVLYGLSIVFLIIILVVGKTVSGSKSWLGIAGMGIQPAEIAKVTTVLALAVFLSKSTTNLSDLKHLSIAIGLILFPMILIFLQPDIGTSIVFFAFLLPVLYWAGADDFTLAIILSPILVVIGSLLGTIQFVVSVFLSLFLLYITKKNLFTAAVVFGITLIIGLSVQAVFERMPVYQQKRILSFMNPEADPLGAGYNVLQAKVAIGSGGFFGKGFMQGTQTQLNFIPEQWTDFIFCVPGEEFGFIGASFVLFLFAFLMLRGIRIASISRNVFASIAAIGFTGIFAVHILINIGMSVGLMPVIGIPLPFLSYGGSALFTNMVMAGLLMNFYSNRKSY